MRVLPALPKTLVLLCLTGSLLAANDSPAMAAEPFFPHAGSHAYDVKSYDVAIGYSRSGRIRGTARVTLVPRRQLRQVSLDFRGPRVEKASLGPPVRFQRRGGKLILRPAHPIAKGELVTAQIEYSGVPPTIIDPDGTKEGWVPTDDGALAVGEPQGTAAWIPCNNIPGDKATFRISISVPPGLKAISNGRLANVQRRRRLRDEVSYSWHETDPMSPYLAVLDIGRGKLWKQSFGGRPYWTLIDPRLAADSRLVVESLPEVIRFESRLFGGYPFEAAGSIVDNAPDLGYALETQSRPIYPYVPDLTTLVHETAHQWFGDSVGLERWPNIWLNEGFATWTEWYYAERHGRRSAQEIFKRLYRVPASNEAFWNPPSAHPGTPVHMFGPSVYIRGAMALQALRTKIGTKTFLRILNSWAVEHRHGSADIGEFIDLAEQVSGRGLDKFFRRWVYSPGKP
jgi:aminopeptidase N